MWFDGSHHTAPALEKLVDYTASGLGDTNSCRELRMEGLTPTATLDTNVLMELWKDQDKKEVTVALLNLAENTQVVLAVTSRIDADITKMPMAGRINELPELNVGRIGSVFRLGVSRLGVDMLASDRFVDVMGSIKDNWRRKYGADVPPDWRDWDHLHGHFLARRDVFLTWDGPILDVASELKSMLGIVVMKPEEFLLQFTEQTNGAQ